MNITNVMDAIAAQLETIEDLTVFPYPAAKVTPPAAIVSWPDSYTFDASYRRGMDRLSLPVVVVVGRPAERTTRDRLGIYCDGIGASSIKAVVEAGTYTAFDSVRVESIDFDVVSIAGTDYMAALFTLDVVGTGA